MTAPTLEAERAAPELLPCPFCGGPATLSERKTHACCLACSATPWLYVKNWNRRTAAPVAEGVALPPLPEPCHTLPQYGGGPDIECYTAEQVRQAQREAVVADRRARGASNPIERACEILGAFPATPSPLPPKEEA